MKIKLIILTIFIVFPISLLNAQVENPNSDWVFDGIVKKDKNRTIKLTFTPGIIEVDPATGKTFFIVTAKVSPTNIPGYVVITKKNVDVKPAKYIDCYTFSKSGASDMLYYANKKTTLKFYLKEGFKGGEIKITITNEYSKTKEPEKIKLLTIGKKGKLSQPAICVFTYKNIPAVLTNEEVKDDALKNIETKYSSFIDSILKVNEAINLKLATAEKKINDTDKEKISVLEKIYREVRRYKIKINKHLKSIKSINKELVKYDKESENAFSQKVNDAIFAFSATNKRIYGKTLLRNSKITGIKQQIEKQEKEKKEKIYNDFYPNYNSLHPKFETIYLPKFIDFKKGFEDKKMKYESNDITKEEVTNFDTAYVTLCQKYAVLLNDKNELDTDYSEITENYRNPKIDSVKNLCSKYITEIEAYKRSADTIRNELIEKGVIISKSMTWLYILIGFLLIGGIASYFVVKFLKIRRRIKQEEADEEAIKDIDIDIDLDESSISRGLITNISEVSLNAYTEINLSDQWDESFVKSCYISKKAITDIYSVCREEQRKKGKEGKAPEIGGFLIGKYLKYEGDKEIYDLFIESYLQPSETEHQDIYQIRFGTKAMHELDNVLHQSQELALVGWFHTHPGHGPFLSQPDLNIHNGTFTAKHQIAIVIDPYNNYDTGIFTRYQNPDMKNLSSVNNKGQKKWFSWDQFVAAQSGSTRKTILPSNLPEKYYEINLNEFWSDSQVSKIYIAYDLIFDLEKISLSEDTGMVFDGYIDGYFDETEAGSNKYDLYLRKIKKEDSLYEGDKVGWIGSSDGSMSELRERTILKDDQVSSNVWNIAVIFSDNRKKISFFSQKEDGDLNFTHEGKYYIDFDEINKWTMT